MSAWIEHLPFAFWLVEEAKPRTIVELGVHGGLSYFTFCQAVSQLQLATKCFAVDTWEGDSHSGYYDETVFDIVRSINNKNYSNFSNLLKTTFEEASERFADSSIDILHIDGYHTYEAVKKDFHTWRRKLSGRSVVLLHDTAVRKDGFGVFKLMLELREVYPTFEFVHGHGLGVVAVGRNVSEGLQALTSLDPDSTECKFIRNMFARVGRGHAKEQEAMILHRRLAEAAVEGQAIAAEHKKQEAELLAVSASLRESIAERDQAQAKVEGLKAHRAQERKIAAKSLAYLDRVISKLGTERPNAPTWTTGQNGMNPSIYPEGTVSSSFEAFRRRGTAQFLALENAAWSTVIGIENNCLCRDLFSESIMDFIAHDQMTSETEGSNRADQSVDNLLVEHGITRLSLREARRHLDERTDRIRELEAELSTGRQAIVEAEFYRGEAGKLGQKLEDLSSEADRYRNDLFQRTVELEVRKARDLVHEQTVSKLHALVEDFERLRRENIDHQANVDLRDRRLVDIQDALDNANREIDKRDGALASGRDDLDALRRTAEDEKRLLNDKLRVLELENSELSLANDRKATEIAAFINSAAQARDEAEASIRYHLERADALSEKLATAGSGLIEAEKEMREKVDLSYQLALAESQSRRLEADLVSHQSNAQARAEELQQTILEMQSDMTERFEEIARLSTMLTAEQQNRESAANREAALRSRITAMESALGSLMQASASGVAIVDSEPAGLTKTISLRRRWRFSTKKAAAEDRPTPDLQHGRIATFHVTKADNHNALKEWSEAEEHYRLALDVDPSLGPVWIQLGHCQREQGRYAEAEGAYLRAVEVQPNEPDGWFYLGVARENLERPLDAQQAFRAALALDPGGLAKDRVKT